MSKYQMIMEMAWDTRSTENVWTYGNSYKDIVRVLSIPTVQPNFVRKCSLFLFECIYEVTHNKYAKAFYKRQSCNIFQKN